jgi:hypothetical protein
VVNGRQGPRDHVLVLKQVFAAINASVPIVIGAGKAIGGIFVGAWNALQAAVSAVWSVIQPVWNGIGAGMDALGQAGSYVFDTVLLPAWHNFELVVGAAWAVISPIWDGIKAGFTALGEAATWLWQNAIVPAWEGIKGAFSTAIGFVTPIFEQLKNGFKGVADFVTGVWTGLGGIVKSALDGVINAAKGPMHWLGSILSKVPTRSGLSRSRALKAAIDLGNTLQGLARGGVAGRTGAGKLFGPGTGTSDSILGVDAQGRPTALVSAGEGVVTAKAMANGAAPYVAAFNAGWHDPMPVVPGQPGRDRDRAYPVGPRIQTNLPGLVELPDGTFGVGLKQGGIAGLKGFKGGGVVSDEEHARMGGGTINESILTALRSVVPGAKLTSAKTDHDADGGFHPKGMAIDVDPSTANLNALWAMRDKLTQIIFDDPKKVWYNVGGQRAEGAAARQIYGESTMHQHGDHIHVAAAGIVGPVSKRGGKGRGRGASRGASSLGTLTPDSTPDEVAAAIISEAQSRGFDEEQTKAILATALQESGLNPKAQGGGGAWHGVFQQDSSYKGRDDPNQNISEFFKRLGAPQGKIWDQILRSNRARHRARPAHAPAT